MKAIIARTRLLFFGLSILSGSVWAQQPRLVLQNGHADIVSSIALSPDQNIIASTSNDKTVKLWDAKSGRLLQTLGNNQFITSVATFSPSGRVVAAASGEQLMLWDVETGELKGRLSTEFQTGIESISFQRGEEIIVIEGSLNWSKFVKPRDGRGAWEGVTYPKYEIWNIKSGKLVKTGKRQFPTYSLAYSGDGRFLAKNQGKQVSVWNLKTNVLWRRLPHNMGSDGVLAFSTNGKRLVSASGSSDHTVKLWDVGKGRLERILDSKIGWIKSLAFSADGKLIAGACKNEIILWNIETGEEIRRIRTKAGEVRWVGFTATNDLIAIGRSPNTIKLWNVGSDEFSPVALSGGYRITKAELLSDSSKVRLDLDDYIDRRIVEQPIVDIGVKLYESKYSWDKRFSAGGETTVDVVVCNEVWSKCRNLGKRPHPYGTLTVTFSPTGNILASGGMEGTIKLWDPENGSLIKTLTNHSNTVTRLFFSEDGKFLISFSFDGTIKYWDANSGDEVATLFIFENGRRIAVTPEGRFDTNISFENIDNLHWIMPDSPFKPLPLEIFMRDYYEPKLLTRLLRGEKLPKLPSLASLNRVQPEVEVLAIKRGSLPDLAEVTVKVSAAEGQFQQGGRAVTMRSDAYDLRLFRDGQLVWQWPEPNLSGARDRNGSNLTPSKLKAWQDATRVNLDPKTGKTTQTVTVRLPHGKAGQRMQFSAYAFNLDRVKSVTARQDYLVPKEMEPVKPRAFIISAGVNAYENPSWDLRFAANDASIMQESLVTRLANQYEVVPIRLISDYKMIDGVRSVTASQATKEALQTVLGALANHPVNLSTLKGVDNVEKLRQAQPDDLVLLSVSSHGHTDGEGKFYFIPYDTGTVPAGKITPDVLSRFISSDELGEWLREIDAGEMVMIVDTCHSAATVEAEGFKAGPMGNRGLGQLTYDKGMRILAASQADDVALEVDKLKQGLLTYALVWDGIEARQADYKPKDGKIAVAEWLAYAVERVPVLYEEIKAGKVTSYLTGRDTGIDEVLSGGTSSLRKNTFQQPSLFDFNKQQHEVVRINLYR